LQRQARGDGLVSASAALRRLLRPHLSDLDAFAHMARRDADLAQQEHEAGHETIKRHTVSAPLTQSRMAQLMSTMRFQSDEVSARSTSRCSSRLV
jgi:hypothetical protein